VMLPTTDREDCIRFAKNEDEKARPREVVALKAEALLTSVHQAEGLAHTIIGK